MGGIAMKLTGMLKRYRAALVALVCLVVFMIALPSLAPKAGASLLDQVKTMLLVIPPIFLLLGLLDVWVPRETMMKFMGPGSGIKGPLLGFLLGSAAAGPLYGAFPVAAVLMKKGASFTNILIFIAHGQRPKSRCCFSRFMRSVIVSRYRALRLTLSVLLLSRLR